MAEMRGLILRHLEAWRRYKAMTQGELAAQAEIARATVNRAEGLEPVSIPNARKLASALGISVQQLQTQAPPTMLPGTGQPETPAAQVLGAA